MHVCFSPKELCKIKKNVYLIYHWGKEILLNEFAFFFLTLHQQQLALANPSLDSYFG